MARTPRGSTPRSTLPALLPGWPEGELLTDRTTTQAFASRRAIGIDLGSKRIGLAVCDAGGLLATPFETVDRVGDESVEHGRILAVAVEIDAVALIVGLPIDLAGDEGPAARNVRNEVRRLTKRVRRAGLADRLAVAVQDERLTTAEAHRSLDDAGHRGDRRDLIDQLAAARILQGWLDAGCPGLGPADR